MVLYPSAYGPQSDVTSAGGPRPLCLFSKPISTTHAAKYSRQQLVGFTYRADSYDCVWQVRVGAPWTRGVGVGAPWGALPYAHETAGILGSSRHIVLEKTGLGRTLVGGPKLAVCTWLGYGLHCGKLQAGEGRRTLTTASGQANTTADPGA